MASYRYPLIAREGRIYILPWVLLALGLHYLVPWPLDLLGWLPVLLALFLFRDPPRVIPANPRGVICPADGRVLAVEHAMDGRLMRHTLLIRITMDRLGPYSVRTPTEGKIMQQWFPASKQARAGQYAQWVQTDEKDDLLMVFYKTPFVRRGACLTSIGERVGQGQRCGYIPFGTQLELWLPQDSRAQVKVGDRVRSGEDVLAMIVHAGPEE